MSKAEIAEAYPNWLQKQRRPDVPEGKPFDAWQLRIMEASELEELSPVQRLAYFSAFGNIGPSSHNVVPHRFRLDGEKNTIEVFADRATVLPESDANGTQVGVSIGCTILNIGRAARSYGMQSRFEGTVLGPNGINPLGEDNDNPYISVGTMQVINGPISNEDPRLVKAMLERKVVRALYDHSALEPQIVAEMYKIAQDPRYASLQLHLLTDQSDLHIFGKSQAQGDREVYNRKAFIGELGEWFRLNNDTDSSTGMRGREFGFDERATTRYYKGFKEQDISPDEITAFGKGGREMVESSSALGIITVDQDIPQEHIKAGALYEELSLFLHMTGNCTAMHAATTETYRPGLQVKALLETDRTPVTVFRVGQPENPQARERYHSARPELSSLILP